MIKPLTKAEANRLIQSIKRIDSEPKQNKLRIGVRDKEIGITISDKDYRTLFRLAGRKA